MDTPANVSKRTDGVSPIIQSRSEMISRSIVLCQAQLSRGARCGHPAVWREGGGLVCEQHSNPLGQRQALANPVSYRQALNALDQESDILAIGPNIQKTHTCQALVGRSGRLNLNDCPLPAVQREKKEMPICVIEECFGLDPTMVRCTRFAAWKDEDGLLICDFHSNPHAYRELLGGSDGEDSEEEKEAIVPTCQAKLGPIRSPDLVRCHNPSVWRQKDGLHVCDEHTNPHLYWESLDGTDYYDPVEEGVKKTLSSDHWNRRPCMFPHCPLDAETRDAVGRTVCFVHSDAHPHEEETPSYSTKTHKELGEILMRHVLGKQRSGDFDGDEPVKHLEQPPIDSPSQLRLQQPLPKNSALKVDERDENGVLTMDGVEICGVQFMKKELAGQILYCTSPTVVDGKCGYRTCSVHRVRPRVEMGRK